MRARALLCFVLVLPVMALPAPAAADAPLQFADWTRVSGGTASGTFLGTEALMVGTAVSDSASTVDGSANWFASLDFSPQLPASDAIAFFGYTAAANYSYTLSFGPAFTAVKDPILHVNSLASTLTFPSGTPITKVSGDSSFVVSGNTVSGTLNGNIAGGDSSGTIRLSGQFGSTSFTVHKTFAADSQDGIYLQIGAPMPPAPYTQIWTYPAGPTPAGYFADQVFITVRGFAGESFRPVQTRCTVDPPTAPVSFNDLPPGCHFGGDGQPFAVGGRHTLYAVSRDPAGTEETPVHVFPFFVAKVPDTTITEAPDEDVWTRGLHFAFASSLPSSTFECRFDSAAFAPCTTPFTGAALPIGSHKFEVRAIGPEGAPDDTPASRVVTIRGPTNYGVGECEAKPIIPWSLFPAVLQMPAREACDISTATCPEASSPERCRQFQRECLSGDVCVRRERTCPRGARCRLTVHMRWFDAEPVANWQAYAMAIWNDYRSTLQGQPPPVKRTCRTATERNQCAATATSSVIGDGQPARGRCGLDSNPDRPSGIWYTEDVAPLGNHYVRRVECDVDLHVAPADPLDAAAAGATTLIWVTTPGVLSVVVSVITGGSLSWSAASTSAVAAAQKPKFASVRRRVARPGPVSLTLKPNAAAKRILRRKRGVAVRLAITLTGTDGKKLTSRQRVTLTRPASKREVCLATRPAPKKRSQKPKRC